MTVSRDRGFLVYGQGSSGVGGVSLQPAATLSNASDLSGVDTAQASVDLITTA